MIYISPGFCGCGAARTPALKVRYETWFLRAGSLEKDKVAGSPQYLSRTAAQLALDELQHSGNPEFYYFIVAVEWLGTNA